MLTAKRLRELLVYDPESGVFRWRVSRGPRAAGDLAGNIDPTHGYNVVMLDRKNYRCARLAWLWMYGRWPDPEVDHWDRNVGNDRIDNLREASKTLNNANRRKQNGSNAFRGVYPKRGKWQAKIKINKRYKSLGTFVDEEDAARAYDFAARNTYGKFANLNFVQ